MLASRNVQGTVASILELLKNSELEEAKRRIQALAPEVKSERDKGSIQAASGIYWSMSKAKEGAMQTWDAARLERAANSVKSSQFSDEFDQGYADTLMNYTRLTQKTE